MKSLKSAWTSVYRTLVEMRIWLIILELVSWFFYQWYQYQYPYHYQFPAFGVTADLSPVCSVRNVNARIPKVTFATYVVLWVIWTDNQLSMIFSTVLLIIISCAITAGTVDYYYQNRGSKLDYERMESRSSVFWRVFMAFSFYRNIKEIFDMKQIHKVSDKLISFLFF